MSIWPVLFGLFVSLTSICLFSFCFVSSVPVKHEFANLVSIFCFSCFFSAGLIFEYLEMADLIPLTRVCKAFNQAIWTHRKTINVSDSRNFKVQLSALKICFVLFSFSLLQINAHICFTLFCLGKDPKSSSDQHSVEDQTS